jgi:hypothetical protein
MSAEEWIERFARELGASPPSEEELARVLELASVAAHSSERRAAPIACWLAGASHRSLGELIEVAKRVGSPAGGQPEC